MAIQMRRGQLANYDKSKMLPGEWGISIDNDSDNQKAFISFAPGVSKEVMMVEDAEEQISVATAEAIDMATEEAEAWAHGNSFHVNDYASGDGSTKSFTLAETPSSILGVYVDGSSVSAYTLSGKTIAFTTAPASGSNNIRVYYTVNTTTDNAKYYKEQAEEVAESIPEDYSELSDDVDQLKNALIVSNAEGAIASFPDGGDGFAVRDLSVQLEPIQDLHGYDNPWPAGAYKNKLRMTVDNIKSWNGGASSWSDNTKVISDITWTIITDSADNVTGIKANGTASATSLLQVSNIMSFTEGDKINGSIGGSINTYGIGASNSGIIQTDGDFTVSASFATSERYLYCRVESGVTVSNKMFYPMLRDPSESATFAPYSNICPISGRSSVTVTRTGVNVWDEEWEVGGIVWTTGEPITATDRIRSKNYCPCKPNTTYYAKSPNGQIYGFWYDSEKNFIEYNPSSSVDLLTAPANAEYFKIVNTGITIVDHDISINYPSTDHDYHAWHVQTVEIPLGQTVYGGTLDVTTGVLTVDTEINQYTGNEEWFTSSSYRFYINGQKEIIRCDQYRVLETKVDYATEIPSGTIGQVINGNVYISDERFNSTNEWKAHLSDLYSSGTPLKVIRKLAAPQTYQLTPQQITTLLGHNNVWSDADSVSVDYVADTKRYIAKVIAEALS